MRTRPTDALLDAHNASIQPGFLCLLGGTALVVAPLLTLAGVGIITTIALTTLALLVVGVAFGREDRARQMGYRSLSTTEGTEGEEPSVSDVQHFTRKQQAERCKEFSELDKEFSELDKEFSKLDKEFSKLDKKFSKLDKEFSKLDKKFSKLDKEFSKLDKEIGEAFSNSQEGEETSVCNAQHFKGKQAELYEEIGEAFSNSSKREETFPPLSDENWI
jgi:peptidoglycan hydrolase CwlO-like protein